MDTVVMNMNGCNIEHDALMTEVYGEEVMCAWWNPQLGESPLSRTSKHVAVPADLASLDVDAFLKRMYEYQC